MSRRLCRLFIAACWPVACASEASTIGTEPDDGRTGRTGEVVATFHFVDGSLQQLRAPSVLRMFTSFDNDWMSCDGSDLAAGVGLAMQWPASVATAGTYALQGWLSGGPTVMLTWETPDGGGRTTWASEGSLVFGTLDIGNIITVDGQATVQLDAPDIADPDDIVEAVEDISFSCHGMSDAAGTGTG